MKQNGSPIQDVTYIILVNWNGGDDTIECLESLFRLEQAQFRVIVCDNGSSDASVENIVEWANGERVADCRSKEITKYVVPNVNKPIRHKIISRAQAEAGETIDDVSLVLIQCEENLGFAGGNNVGLRFALLQPDMANAWLLNNDTVAEPLALKWLLEEQGENPESGMVGSTVVYYDAPDRVQALGGAIFFPPFAISYHLGRMKRVSSTPKTRAIKGKLSYIFGASMLVTRPFLEMVGLMSEEYFIYYEEIDWALRARGKFSITWAVNSKIYHKAGASTGSSNDMAKRSFNSDLYLMGNRLVFARRYFPQYVFTVRLFLVFECILRLINGKFDSASAIWAMAKTGKFEAKYPR